MIDVRSRRLASRSLSFAAACVASVLLAACGSTVDGGGGGSDGEGGRGSQRPSTGSNSPNGVSCERSTVDGGGPITTGIIGELGVCNQESSVASTGSSTTSCEADFTCPGGDVGVACVMDQGIEVCDCKRDGTTVGQCSNDGYGCVFPENCCYPLLGGGDAPKAPGSGFGACTREDGGTVTGGSTTGTLESLCTNDYACDCGALTIHCETYDGGAACTCTDENGFLAGHCTQSALDCDYETNCCKALVE